MTNFSTRDKRKRLKSDAMTLLTHFIRRHGSGCLLLVAFALIIIINLVFLDAMMKDESQTRKGWFSFPTAWSRLHVRVQRARVPVDANVTTFLLLAPPVPDQLPTKMVKRAYTFTPTNASSSTLSSTNNVSVSMPSSSSSSCPVTSQVRIVSTGGHYWILESLDIHGRPKREGGDEYYITYTDESMSSSSSPTAVALVSDHQDGRYGLEFVTSPSLLHATTTTIRQRPLTGTGSVTIILQYSCGLGHLAPPSKQRWRTGGAINAQYKVKTRTAPHMDNFVPPQGSIDLSRYDRVLAFGDSTMGNFANHTLGNNYNIYWPGNVGAALNTQTVDQVFLPKIQRTVNHALRNHHNVAIVLGSSVWDILADNFHQGPHFQDHREACRRLIASIRNKFPSVSIYWKSATAVHIHRVADDKKDWFHVQRVFYMSSSRARDLHRYQQEIMLELNVTVLDLYAATQLSAEHLKPGDGRHYTDQFNKMMLDWFYPHYYSKS